LFPFDYLIVDLDHQQMFSNPKKKLMFSKTTNPTDLFWNIKD
jgi:hypothetical protein